MKNNKVIITVVLLALAVFYLFASGFISMGSKAEPQGNQVLAEKFEYISQNGNSSCSQAFQSTIPAMSDNQRLQGSCCSQMSWHRYSEQVNGLKKYAHIAEIPPDPYDIEAGLAKKLLSYYDIEISEDGQKAYDFAMANSSEKGPCCCKCWRWYVYGGLGKFLVKEKGFSGQQLTEVWDLSDGCGGDSEHHHG